MGRLVPVEQCKRGTELPQARLTDDDVRLMRALHDEHGVSIRQVAQKFGLAYSWAWRICRYAGWRHVR